MSLHAMVMGSLVSDPLVSDPIRRTGASGKAFVTASVRVSAESASEHQEAFLASLIAFSPPTCEALAVHRKGDTICAGGRASLKEWQGKDGQTKHGLAIVVESVMSEYQFATRKKSAAPAGVA